MGITNTDIQRKTGFFHALGKVLTLDTNLIGNESYKSAHNVRTSEIWTDVPAFAEFLSDAITEDINNSSVTMVGTASTATMYPLANTNYQTWFLDSGTPSVFSNGFVPSVSWSKPLINPSDIPDTAGAPSNGYNFRMYRNDGTTLISYDNAFFEVDYFAGLIKYQLGATPVDSSGSSGLGFQMSQSGFEAVALTFIDRKAYLDTNGPKAIAFLYSGTFLDDYLNNISGESGGNSGSEEWQSSVNGYLVPVGNTSSVSGLTGINSQIGYLNNEYNKYYIYTDTDISGVTWSGITATNSYYKFNGSTFSSYTITDSDDANRFLLIEGGLTLDTIVISPTGSVTEFPDTSVQADRILEYTGTASTGLTYSAWQVTDPRLGMVTTLDNKSSSLVRYVGIGTGWVEYNYEITYKVNSQKDLIPNTTDTDYDIAISETLTYEPSGSKSVDIMVNGVEMPLSSYVWGNPSGTTSIVVDSSSPNTITTPNSGAPIIGEYLQLDNGSNYYRQVTATSSASATQSLITYSGISVAGITSAYKFTLIQRTNNVARQGDWLLWVGSAWYELDQISPADLITLEYVTNDSGALNS